VFEGSEHHPSGDEGGDPSWPTARTDAHHSLAGVGHSRRRAHAGGDVKDIRTPEHGAEASWGATEEVDVPSVPREGEGHLGQHDPAHAQDPLDLPAGGHGIDDVLEDVFDDDEVERGIRDGQGEDVGHRVDTKRKVHVGDEPLDAGDPPADVLCVSTGADHQPRPRTWPWRQVVAHQPVDGRDSELQPWGREALAQSRLQRHLPRSAGEVRRPAGGNHVCGSERRVVGEEDGDSADHPELVGLGRSAAQHVLIREAEGRVAFRAGQTAQDLLEGPSAVHWWHCHSMDRRVAL